jgi:hypothetical protein
VTETQQQQQHEPRGTCSDRSLTGSLLFPDLVWAHWAWQSRAHPHEFPVRGYARRFRARLNGRASRRRNGSERPVEAKAPEPDLRALYDQYTSLANAFVEAEGEIVHAHWCVSEASAVALTVKKKKRFSWFPGRQYGDLRLHRATDWVTAEAPKIAELLHRSDTLAIRITRVLHSVPRTIAVEWIFNEQSYLLGFVERLGGRPTKNETSWAVDRHEDELKRIERYYDRAARKTARIRYFGGLVLGVGAVGVLAVSVALTIGIFGTFDRGADDTRTFFACFVAGAVGAMVSVMIRMRQEDGIRLDYEVGALLIYLLGAFRPVLGAVFGTVTYFALESGFLQINAPAGKPEFFYYALFAFVAGFTERFARVLLTEADLTVERALSEADTKEQLRSGTAAAPGISTRDENPATLSPPHTTA